MRRVPEDPAAFRSLFKIYQVKLASNATCRLCRRGSEEYGDVPVIARNPKQAISFIKYVLRLSEGNWGIDLKDFMDGAGYPKKPEITVLGEWKPSPDEDDWVPYFHDRFFPLGEITFRQYYNDEALRNVLSDRNEMEAIWESGLRDERKKKKRKASHQPKG